MGETVEVRVPDIGDVDRVDVIEVLVNEGDAISAEQGIVTLESDKASMDVPAPRAGTVRELKVKTGDSVARGDLLLLLDVAADGRADASPPAAAPEKEGESPPREDSRPPSGGAGAESGPAGADPPAEATVPPSAEPQRGDPSTPVSAAPAEAREGADMHAEVLVLGAGPGGYTAAFRAADLGKSVVLVEKHSALGGVCLNVGCIPSKALLHAARVLDEAEEFADKGIRFGKPKIDLDRLRGWKQSVVDRLTGGLAGLAKRRKVEVVRGTGTFSSPHTLAVEGGDGPKTISFDAAIVAVGSRVARIPGIPWDDERVIDSTGALELADVPKKLLVVGGGIIGLEMATVYGALGSELTIVELMDGLIPGCDRDLVKPLQKRLEERLGAEILTGTKVAELKAQKNGLKAFLERADGGEAPKPKLFDRALVAVGRRPNGDRIGAEAAGLEVDERGFLRVDKQQRTNVPHIFAIGDLVGQPMLAHKATHEGKVAAEVASGEKSAFDARVIPSVAYTDPEIAWVGLTETEAKEKGIAYEKGAFPWAASGRSLGIGREEGSTKLLFDPETHRIVGAGIVGPNAGDLISEAALAIEMDCEAADIGLTIHPHPTLSETVAFAAEAFEGTLTDLYIPKRKKK